MVLDYKTSFKTTFVMHLGKFRWLQMPFRLLNAPNWFLYIMEDIINGSYPESPLPTNIYLDDVGVKGDDIE